MIDTLLLTGQIPEINWDNIDDNCDCTYQRIGWWTNPYIGKTLELRLCCMWKVLIEKNPEMQAFFREIPAFHNYNTDTYETEPHDWNGEDDMPRAIWYRQIASRTGRDLEQIRHDYDHLQPPRGTKAKLLQYLRDEASQAGMPVLITDVKEIRGRQPGEH